MGIEEAIATARKISSGNYSQEEFNAFFEYMDSADPGDIHEVLNAYHNSLQHQDSYQLHVHPDFIDYLKGLKPQMEQPVSAYNIDRTKKKIDRTRWAAAAALILGVAGAFGYFNNKTAAIPQIAKVAHTTDVAAPQSNRAMITLASGRRLFLDSIAAGSSIATQGDVQVLKLADGQIAYRGMTSNISYNTLTNPRGSKPVMMTLADGSSVWLNAGSALTYPVAFIGKERTVQLTGEAYFEIAQNAAMPFIVKNIHDDAKVQVLGTHFNVNAYDDESAMKVTLLEGSVKVSQQGKNNLLHPGQQAQMSGSDINIINGVDLDEVMAWKNGKFQFGEKTDIHTIMRQISRWYDVDVRFEGQVNGHIGGSISLNTNVAQVLKMLETTGSFHFKIDGKQVTVLP